MQINPYFNFPGNTEEVLNFYKSVLGGEVPMIVRYKETGEASKLPAEDLDKIMHMGLQLPNGLIIMATDYTSERLASHQPGNNFHLSISVSSKEEADSVFNGLSAGGSIMVPMRMEFWGAYFGMFTDKFGIQWMVNFDEKFSEQVK